MILANTHREGGPAICVRNSQLHQITITYTRDVALRPDQYSIFSRNAACIQGRIGRESKTSTLLS